MASFLENIAKYYLNSYNTEDLHKLCFIFPNKRSGTFFRKHIQDLSDNIFVYPEIITISDWINELTQANEIGKIQQLFILYSAYRDILIENESSEIPSFEDFIFWGDTILNDFNDCDKYIVNPEYLFSNLKDIKNINTDYLTPEQKELLRDFFGMENIPESRGDNFWINFSDSENSSENVDRFIHFWELLLPLYKRFNDILLDNKMCYSGMSYRKAVEILQQKEDFNYEKYIFIGFNMLSTSEYKIFDILKKKNLADFFWDFNSPLIKDPQNKASKFISKYIKHFKSPITEEDNVLYPKIEVINVPSNIGQVKYVESLIENLKNENPDSDLLKTAIVLPDENMLMPMISFIPDNIDKVNITMGFPFKNSSLASFIKLLSTLHLKATSSGGERKYFYDDMKSILLHPFIKDIDGVTEILNILEDKRAYFVSSQLFQNYAILKDIFSNDLDVSNQNFIILYLGELLSDIESLMEETKTSYKLELKFISDLKVILSQLNGYVDDYRVNINEKSAFFLIERLLNLSTVSFEGEPLEGLQIMGILESRCLDFDNIIMMSMNEKIFPKKHFAKTFIPISLRTGFGLSTLEYQESIFAYYFYRLISRAKNVYLIYDSRTQGSNSGEPSRYIYQLKYLYDHQNLQFITGQFKISTTNKKNISVNKDASLMSKINLFRTEGSEKYLSASSINTYIDCQLKFYFNQIENIIGDIIVDDYIDSATFGTIIHNVLSKLYIPYTNKTLSKTDFQDIKGKQLDHTITQEVNKEYFHKTDLDLDQELIGEGILIGKTVKYIIESVIDYDSQIEHLEFVQSEKKEYCHWDINDHLSINLKQYIDRVDNADGILRIVDYKTGKDDISVKSIEDMFIPNKKRQKAILQLLIYCNVYHQLHPETQIIKPIIYKLKEIKKGNNFFIKFGNEELLDYRDVNKEFLEELSKVLYSLFDSKIPFAQTSNIDMCEYCEFAQICH